MFSGGPLSHVFKMKLKLSELEIMNFTLQLLDGLTYIHQLGYTYTDIKSSNIFMTKFTRDASLKIGDLDDPIRILR